MPFHGWGMDHMAGYGWAAATGMMLWSLFWLAVLVALVVLAWRTLSSRPLEFRSSAPEPTAQALSILAERYARGEIDHDEYIQRRETLLSADRH